MMFYVFTLLFSSSAFAALPSNAVFLKITETKSLTQQTTMELSADKKWAWLKSSAQKINGTQKKLSLEKVKRMEAQLTEFVWDYNLRQNLTGVDCQSYVEIELVTTQDKAKVCETDFKNFGRVRAYLGFLKKEATL